MKFTCLQENLSKSLQIVTKAISAKSPLPILSNILIKTENGGIKLAATNLETTIITHLGGAIEEEGEITVPAKLFKDFISNLPPENVTLSTIQDVLHISSNKSKSRFNGISAEEYPDLPTFPSTDAILEIDSKTLDQIVSKVTFASSSDSNKSPTFTGILVDYKNNVLTLAATDGFRLAEVVMELDSTSQPFSAVIQARTMHEITKIFSSTEEKIKLFFDDSQNKLLFLSGDTFVSTSVIGEQYPDYKRIIPTEFVVNASFDAQEFLDAVKLTHIIAKESSNIIKIRFDPEGTVKISSLAEEAGSHESNVNAEIEGDLVEIAMNAKYLMDYLSNIKTQQLRFATKGNMSPCLFTSDEHQNYTHIIMPMQI